MPDAGPGFRRREAIASTRLALNSAVFEWSLRHVRRALRRQALEPALAWSLLAARSAVHHGFGWLASPALEQALLEVAARLPVPSEHARGAGAKRWLHVMDRAYAVGGHTALVQRWATLDPRGGRHSLLLLSQRGPVHPGLVDAVQATGGGITALDPDGPLVDRALRLRQAAWRDADRVVLHVHPWSVLPVAALGVDGGPPVMLLNHLSQTFWVGGSIADLVLSLRGSALEWSRTYRGIARNALLPIPLAPLPGAGGREAARRALGLPADAPVLLTIGHGYKYRPLPGLDFLAAAAAILRARPDARLLAVGPREDAGWLALRASTGGRALALGPRLDLPLFHAAADVYLEGFPIGSPTALLEAGLRGLPCVRAPLEVPSPFSIDGAAVDGLTRPPDGAGYVAAAVALLDDAARRATEGAALARAIETHHTASGWGDHLAAAGRSLPDRHRGHPLAGAAPLPAPIRDFSIAIATLHHPEDTLTVTLRSALEQGLGPRLDAPLLAALAATGLTRDPRLLLRRPLLAAVAASLVGPRVRQQVRRARGWLASAPGGDDRS